MSNKVHCINDTWLVGEGPNLQKIDPCKTTEVWQGQAASSAQVDLAVQAAYQAGKAWRNCHFNKRLDICRAFAKLIQEYKTILVHTISAETGKPLWEAETEVNAVIGKIEISRRAYHQRTGKKTVKTINGYAITRHKARGVCAILGPFNFPAHLPNGHIVPALLAGNSIVFKPSEQAPKTAELMVRMWLKAGLPSGVLNLLQGDKETSQALVNHPKVDGIFFTGSSQTGFAIQQACMMQPEKILAMEMGGNNPLIIGSSAIDKQHLEASIFNIIQSAYITAGQRCTCARRLLVPNDESGEQLLVALSNKLKQLVVGHYDAQPAPYYGSLVSFKAAESLLDKQKYLLAEGAVVLNTMRLLEASTGLLSPGLIDVTDIVSLADEEHFGPLLLVSRYHNFADAIERANDTRYGLSAGILTNDKQQYQRFYREIRAGIINWNQPLTGASSAAPFGGVGISGNARPSAFYAADYCAYPTASLESETLTLPPKLPSGYASQH
ncbi:succinylglutamate-semialdehyde dehydrogenase [Catenovulum sediminis]|uniref:Succinylglutamate-semialdehyde dehydrogenase n=1 Tax=Catenovulum sediminis TaxID=1740262 RepID=A0ABV1REG2_9ALTE